MATTILSLWLHNQKRRLSHFKYVFAASIIDASLLILILIK